MNGQYSVFGGFKNGLEHSLVVTNVSLLLMDNFGLGGVLISNVFESGCMRVSGNYNSKEEVEWMTD